MRIPAAVLAVMMTVVMIRAEEISSGESFSTFPPQQHQKDADARLESFFRSTLELVRPEMRFGNASLGISVMDPLSLPDYQFERPGELLQVSARFSRIRLPRLSTFRIDRVAADAGSLSVSIRCSYPSLTGVGDYLFETSTFGVPVVSATGKFTMRVSDINATGHVQLKEKEAGGEQRVVEGGKTTRRTLRCSRVSIESTEDHVAIEMEDLAGDDFLRRMLNPHDVYLEYKPRIHAKIGDAFRKVLDFALEGFEF